MLVLVPFMVEMCGLYTPAQHVFSSQLLESLSRAVQAAERPRRPPPPPTGVRPDSVRHKPYAKDGHGTTDGHWRRRPPAAPESHGAEGNRHHDHDVEIEEPYSKGTWLHQSISISYLKTHLSVHLRYMVTG